MNTFDRRHLLTTTGAGAVLAAARWLGPTAPAAEPLQQRIKIGQIGTGHEHASGKMSTLRKSSDHYEVVGIAESDPELRKSREKDAVYRDLTWMTEEQLLNTKGLQAVAVEVRSADDRIMEITGQCIEAGMHVHLDHSRRNRESVFPRARVDRSRMLAAGLRIPAELRPGWN